MDFKQAEAKFKQLKAQFETGVIPESEFKKELEKLMVRDEQGNWWVIGYETGRWYRHDGTNWVQTDLSYSPTQKLASVPEWVVMFWVMWGLASGFAIAIAIGAVIGNQTNSIIGIASIGLIGGAISGFSIASALRVQNALSDWKSILWIILGWVIGHAIGGRSVIVGWAIGGLGIAISLRVQNTLSDWKSILWIILGWASAGAIGWAISVAIKEAISGDIGWVISWAIGGTIGGAIGGFVMIWQIKRGRT